MKESLIIKIKCLIWFVGIIALVLAACGIKSCTAQPEAQISLEELCFWPADAIPHPEVPHHVPISPEEASREEYDDFMRSQGLECPFEDLISVG